MYCLFKIDTCMASVVADHIRFQFGVQNCEETLETIHFLKAPLKPQLKQLKQKTSGEECARPTFCVVTLYRLERDGVRRHS